MSPHNAPPPDPQTLAELSRFRAAMDMSGDSIYLVDRKTMRFLDVNQTACTRMGYSREELLKMGPHDLLTSSREDIERIYDAVIAAGGSGMTTESTARTKDGRESITELHRRALRMQEGWIIVSIARDITRRKRTEQALLESENRFRLTFELAGSGIAHVGLDGRFQRVNRRMCEILGYSAQELVGRSVKELSHPEDRDKTDASRARVHSGELESMRSQKRYVRKDGTTVWVDLTVALMRDSHGMPLHEISVIHDETERRHADAALRDSARKLQLFTDNVPAMTASWDTDLNCSFVNKRFAEFLGAPAESFLGKHVREVLGEAAYGELEGRFLEALRGHPVTFQRIRKPPQGEDIHLEIRLLPHFGDDGKVVECFSVATDISEHKRTEERIRRVAHHDSLTGLPNRLLFNDRLSQAISLARRDSRRIALLYMDLDRFKPVNDTLGHTAGDELLQAVAARISALVRESDTVARVGGDEFTVILPGVARREDAEAIASKISAAIAAPFQLGVQKRSVEISTSIGIAFYPEDAAETESLVKAADAAMYREKQAR